MMNLIFALAMLFVALPSSHADSYRDKCSNLKSCVAYVAKLTGDHYTYEVDLKGKLEASADLAINVKNADLLLTQMLNANGYTRVPLGVTKTYTIMRTSEAKDTLLPKVKANAKFEPVLPNNWDWYDMHYEVEHASAMTEMPAVTRNFMPAHTRVVMLDAGGNTIIVTGPVPVLRRIYALLKDMDRPALKKRN